MAIHCQILIKKPKTGVYYSGQSVTGTIKYDVKQPTELKDIVLSFYGKGKCHWTERKRRNSSTVTESYTGTEEYFNYERSLIVKKDKITSIDAGCYEEDFEFLLPENLPSTYKDDYCNIVYRLKLKFHKKGIFTLDKRFTAEINVQGNVSVDNESAVTFGLEKKLTKLFSSKKHVIKLKSQVNKRLFTPGEAVNVIYEVTNDTDIIIPKVKTELVAYKVYTANCGHKKHVMNIIKECSVNSPCIPDNGVANLSNTVKILDNLYSLQNTKVFDLEYRLKVTLKLPMPHLNAYVEAPIVIGRKLNSEDMEMAGDDPPTYWEAMLEEDDQGEYEEK